MPRGIVLRSPRAILALTVGCLSVGMQSTAAQTAVEPSGDAALVTCPGLDGMANVIGVGDPGLDAIRRGQLTGVVPLASLTIRRASSDQRTTVCQDAPGAPAAESAIVIRLLPSIVRFHLNSAYPRGGNDGELWQGRGISQRLQAGFAVHAGPVSAAFAPAIAYQQNRAFAFPYADLAGYSRFAYGIRGGSIDWPVRFGGEPFWTFHPGQSYVRVDAYGAAAGVSTANMWWGPARRYPILMSNTAPGFPHFFLGTSRPVDIWIGRLEAEASWGVLHESRYFDADAFNDRRLFAGIVVTLEPRLLPGLYLGASRVEISTIPPQGIGIWEALSKPYRGLQENPSGVEPGTADDGLLSAFGRWVFPASGVEVYFEWAREDHWLDLNDLLTEPDHSQAYTLGLQHIQPLGDRMLRLATEWIHLEGAITSRSYRGLVSFYVHGGVHQGYTERGQLLGAFVGPGSDAQYAEIELGDGTSATGVVLERIRYDTDAYHARWAQNYGFHGHDLELSAGLHHKRTFHDLSVDAALLVSRRRNRNFTGLDGSTWDFLHETNLGLDLQVSWRPTLELDLPVPFHR